MKWEEKAEAARLIEDLADDGKTFDAEKARRLIRLVPLSKIFSLSAQDAIAFDPFSGYTPEFGNVRIQEEPPEDPSLKGLHFIGGYKVMHKPGVLTIFNDLSSPASVVSGGACAILYSPRNREPGCMRLYHVVPRTFLGLPIGGKKGVWEDWKVPAEKGPAP